MSELYCTCLPFIPEEDYLLHDKDCPVRLYLVQSQLAEAQATVATLTDIQSKHNAHVRKQDERLVQYINIIAQLEEHNQNAQSLNGLLELRVEELEKEAKLLIDGIHTIGKERDALVEAARAVVLLTHEYSIDGHDEWEKSVDAMAKLIGGGE